MAATMQVTASTLGAPAAAGLGAGPLNSGSSARVNSSQRLAMRSLVAVRAESNPASGGTTDKAGYAQTNPGGSFKDKPEAGNFASDVVDGVAEKVQDSQKSAANLGSETQENLGNVGKELKDGVTELGDDTKNIVDKTSKSNPGHSN